MDEMEKAAFHIMTLDVNSSLLLPALRIRLSALSSCRV